MLFKISKRNNSLSFFELNFMPNLYFDSNSTSDLELALSNKYLEVIIQCQESKIFNEKVEVLF